LLVPAKKQQYVPARAPQNFSRHAACIAALWIAIFLVYSNSFYGALVFDNRAILEHDPRIRAATAENLRLIFAREYWYPATNSGLYRPLATLSYLFNNAILGEETSTPGYHAINLALHELNAALVYILGLAIFAELAPAFAMAAIWSVHPLLTESVTNIVGRADLLAAFGVIAGLLCHIRAAAASGRKRAAWLGGLIIAQAIGIFSKESAAILPAVMVLYDMLFARNEWRKRAWSYAALLIPLAAFFYLRSRVETHLEIPPPVNPIASAGIFAGRMTAIKVLGKLLWLFVWPAHLSGDYSFNAIPLFAWDPLDWAALAALLACVALIGLVFFLRRDRRILFFAGFFVLAILPTSNFIFPIGAIMAERFMYLPAIGLCGCAAIALQKMRGRGELKYVALAAVCAALGARAYARNFDWRDRISFWSSAARAYPDCARAHYNLGKAWIEQSQPVNAAAEFEAALRIRPDYSHAQAALADALAKIPGRLDEAIAHYQAALDQDPNFAEARYNYGAALARASRIQDAVAQWQAAIRIKPDFAEAHYNLAVIYARQDRWEDAAEEYRAALRARPDYPEAHYGLGGAYLQLNRPAEAFAELEVALHFRPDPQLQQTVAELRARLRETP
jgi:tetratricopeptide (TPR) repeat protein